MDHLIKILRSFSEQEEDRAFLERFVELLKYRVMGSVQSMYAAGLGFQNGKVIL